MNGDDSRIDAALKALEAKLAPLTSSVTLTELPLDQTDMSARPTPPLAADGAPEGLEEAFDPAIENLREALGEL